MARIVLSDVTKIYRGGVEAVRDVSFTIPEGDFCVVTGPNGAGKSTLMRLIANLEPVTAGAILIGDAPSQSWRLGRHDVAGFVDARSFDPAKNIYDNMSAGLKAFGLSRRDVEARTLAAADRMELGGLMARRAGAVSCGEAARAALGRALAHQPRALVFDDPFVRLDGARRLALRRELRRLQRASGAAVILATNDWADALALADVLVVMDRGRLVAAGAPDELFARPATADLARLTGAPPMNVLPVRANQTGLSLEDGTHLGGASVMTTQTFALLGVRPEALYQVVEDATPSGAVFPVRVEEIERTGHESVVHGRVGAFPFVARVAGRVEPPASEPLKLAARREDLHMFDAGTGARL